MQRDRLAVELKALKARHGYALLWDAHSIESVLPSLFEGRLPDLNLGTFDNKACDKDIAEVIGTAIGLQLLFGVPLGLGIVITALDVFIILYLQRLGFRYVEALIITLLGVIAVCFAVQIGLADPNWGEVIRGFAPTVEIVKNPEML